MTIGLSYMTGGDRFILTAGSAGLVYDPGTGKVTGDLASGLRQELEPRGARCAAVAVRGDADAADRQRANGSLTGTITHAGRRDYDFRVAMTEKTVKVAIGPGCPSARPTDAP